jgi:hypothetical protein
MAVRKSYLPIQIVIAPKLYYHVPQGCKGNYFLNRFENRRENVGWKRGYRSLPWPLPGRGMERQTA